MADSRFDRILEGLRFVYGDAAAPGLAVRISELEERYRGRVPAAVTGKIDAGSVVLITYADQVWEGAERPLAVLECFLRDRVRGVVDHVHILPFYPWSSDDGFSVIDYEAVDPEFGTWEDIARLSRSFGLMFDAVINHISAESEWVKRYLEGEPRYARFFLDIDPGTDLSAVTRPRATPLLTEFAGVDRPHRLWTTFSADQVDLNYENPEVFLEVARILLEYVIRGARLIRLDAIGFLWKEVGTSCMHLPKAHAVIRLFRQILDGVAPQVLLISETNVPHAENISYFGAPEDPAGREAQLVYQFPLPPLTAHALLRQTATHLTRWAAGLEATRGDTAFFNFLASHDGVGVRPVTGILPDEEVAFLAQAVRDRGGRVSERSLPDGGRAPYELNINYLDLLQEVPGALDDEEGTDRTVARFLAAHSILLSMPGVPGIYFHSLFGSRGDREGLERTGQNRAVNREKLDRARLEAELKSPEGRRRRIFDGLCRRLAVRRRLPAFAPESPFAVLDAHPGVFAVRRGDAGRGEILALTNVTSNTIRLDGLGAVSGVDHLGGDPIDGIVRLGPHQSRWIGDPWASEALRGQRSEVGTERRHQRAEQDTQEQDHDEGEDQGQDAAADSVDLVGGIQGEEGQGDPGKGEEHRGDTRQAGRFEEHAGDGDESPALKDAPVSTRTAGHLTGRLHPHHDDEEANDRIEGRRGDGRALRRQQGGPAAHGQDGQQGRMDLWCKSWQEGRRGPPQTLAQGQAVRAKASMPSPRVAWPWGSRSTMRTRRPARARGEEPLVWSTFDLQRRPGTAREWILEETS